jgi:hypothetical protein
MLHDDAALGSYTEDSSDHRLGDCSRLTIEWELLPYVWLCLMHSRPDCHVCRQANVDAEDDLL